MNLILAESRVQVIVSKRITFEAYSSFYLIKVAARVKNRNLMVKIDEKSFPVGSPASFSGGKLHDLLQTLYFFIFLKGKNHQINLNIDKADITVTLESLEVYTLSTNEILNLDINQIAEDGDRRPWLAFVFVNLPLQSFTPTLTYRRRKTDSDDIKIIFDGKSYTNLFKTIKYFLWRYAGFLLPKNETRTEKEVFNTNVFPGLHYLEFWADRMPILKNIVLNFGIISSPEGIPTVIHPQWTGDFADDTEEILLSRAIYGETGGESWEAKIAVGWTIKNRVNDLQKRWGDNYHAVILQPIQYEPFIDPASARFKKITNPQLDNSLEKTAWNESFQAANKVISGEINDSVSGANHFYADYGQKKPPWANENQFIKEIGITKFYKL